MCENVQNDAMINNVADLRRWIDEIPSRHSKVDTHRCSCGWENEYAAWEEHVDGGPIHDLPDVIASCTWNDDRAVSCSDIQTQLYEIIDRSQDHTDVLMNYLTDIALGGYDHPNEVAAAVICKMWPRSDWAQAIRKAGIEPDLTLAPDAPENV